MTIHFEPGVGEQACFTMIEQAAAILNFYRNSNFELDIDSVIELVEYLNTAIDFELDKEEKRIREKRGPIEVCPIHHPRPRSRRYEI